MTEIISPIPSRLKNVAVGGHVAGADQIIDDQLNKDQETLNANSAYLGDDEGQAVIPGFDPETDTVHTKAQVLTTAKKDAAVSNILDKGPSNGMGRAVLKADDDFKTVVESATGGNTIFVIRYDYTLTGDVTVPTNCVLEFDGGGISNSNGNSYTIDFNNCIIDADYKIFDTVLPFQNSEFWHEINPKWFGVIDDGVTDNVVPLTDTFAFASRLKKYGISYRMLGKIVPTIKFDTTGPIKITSPIEITIACNILGFPTFYYTGQHISGSGAIIINNGEVGGKYEFNVTSFLTGTVDLSDGVLFAGVHLKYHMYGDIEIKEINGFNTGVLLCGTASATETAACLRLNPRRITCCLNAIYAQIYNGAWPNEIELHGCMFGGTGSNFISAYPSGFSRGAFIKVVGDGSIRANSWHIHDNALEGTIGSYPIDFIYSDNNYNDRFELSGFSLDNNRVENIQGYLANIKKGISMNVDEHQYFDVSTINIRDYNMTIPYSVAAGFGITPSNFPITNVFKFNTNGILRTSIMFQFGIFFSPYVAVVVNGTQLNGVIIKLKAKEFIYCPRRAVANGFQPYMALNSSLSPISIPSTLVYTGSRKETQGSLEYLVLNNASTATSFMLFNSGDSEIYVALGAKNISDLEGCVIQSTQKIDLVNNGVLTKGTTAERNAMPALYSTGSYPDTTTYKGYEFFDTTLSKPVYSNGSSWVDATGTPV